MLARLYGAETAPFLGRLGERGFFVAGESVANYPQTALSLASSLNATYLDAVVRATGARGTDRRLLNELIDDERNSKHDTSSRAQGSGDTTKE